MCSAPVQCWLMGAVTRAPRRWSSSSFFDREKQEILGRVFTVITVQPNYYDLGRLLSITTRRRKQTLSKDHLLENIPIFQITSVITCHQPVPGTVWVTAIRATSNRTLWWQLNLWSSGSVVKQFYKSISAGSNTFQYQDIQTGDRHGERWLKFKITLAGR